MPKFDHARLTVLIADVCRAFGTEGDAAKVVARHLVDANLAGHDSHGVMRVLQYVKEIDSGKIDPQDEERVLDEWDTGAVIDAQRAFGQVACHNAMQLAIDKASHAGIAAVTIRHANHSGRLGTYVEMAAASGMIGIAMANGGGSGQWVAPFGGCEPRLSTNPLAIGLPSGKPFPIVLDMSTSIAPEGKVRDYVQRGQLVPEGWLVDATGQPTRDPHQLYGSPPGALLPFGGQAGHKGYGLAFIVDAFAGALSQAGCPRAGEFDPMHRTGLFMMALQIDRFSPLAKFILQMSDMSDYVKSSRPAAGFDRILIPGEFEHEQRQQRTREGIEIPESVWNEMTAIVERLNQEAGETVIFLPEFLETTS
ncbi:MAG: Ldh family oxidoreductase [Planctomycetaceae bacterium]|nr:Ldh family oxidoreductase [Planctomycetaceae bacterium]